VSVLDVMTSYFKMTFKSTCSTTDYETLQQIRIGHFWIRRSVCGFLHWWPSGCQSHLELGGGAGLLCWLVCLVAEARGSLFFLY